MAVWLMPLKGVNEMSKDKVINFPPSDEHKEDGVEEAMEMVGIQMSVSGIAPPFTMYPGRDDVSGVAARAAILRFADIIAHENLNVATEL